MPFTFSHPAAVLPFCKVRPFVFSALVIGSMAPDLDSFLHLSTTVTFGHSAAGILQFCLPTGLLVFLLFHAVLKVPLTALLPEGHQRRLPPFLTPRLPRGLGPWIAVVLAIPAGTLTYLFWDSLTHRYGWMVLQFPILAVPVTDSLPLYSFLQHFGTVFGALILALAYGHWYRKARVHPLGSSPRLSSRHRAAVLLGLLGSAGLFALVYAGFRAGAVFDPVDFVRDAVLLGVSALFISCLFFGFLWPLGAGRDRGG